MTSNLITIITPVHNAKKFINRLMCSVASQTYKNFQHILIDDCSIDGSYEILVEYAKKDPRIEVIKLTSNVGVVRARNFALNIAKGDFVTFLDVDDLWLPDKLLTQLTFMLKESVAISFTDYRHISEDGNFTGKLLKGPSKVGWHLLHMTRYVGCLTVMINRKFVPDFYFDESPIDYHSEDFLAWSKIIKKFGFAKRCPYDLARYSVTSNSRSSNGIKVAKLIWRLYRDIQKIPVHLSLIYFLFYSLFVSYKRLIYKPRYDSFEIDGKYWHL